MFSKLDCQVSLVLFALLIRWYKITGEEIVRYLSNGRQNFIRPIVLANSATCG